MTAPDPFAPQASRYEAWYETPRGRRAEEAERGLLDWLLAQYGGAGTVLEVGCGTGHFTRWAAARGFSAIGLDSSAAMLGEARRRLPLPPLVRGRAEWLPLRGTSVDVVLLVTTLEFLEDPRRALAEAARVARQGIAVITLNRWSPGGFSRRFGAARRRPLLGRARDFSLPSLRRDVAAATGERLRTLRWTSGLFPGVSPRWRAPVPCGGGVLAVAAVFHPEPHAAATARLR